MALRAVEDAVASTPKLKNDVLYVVDLFSSEKATVAEKLAAAVDSKFGYVRLTS